MLSPEEVLLNKIAQNKLPLEDGIQWYDCLDEEQQKKAMYHMMFYLSQSGPTPETIVQGIEEAPIKKTMTPVVIFQKNNLSLAFQKISKLPATEYRKSFIVMLSIFKASDTLRREKWCKGECSHEWHHLDDE
ncbi:DUF5958 family protein [Cytophagaceae bacterium DM2B3-1]|uniref:DUF5958 family protein n=1 Tax=Xanthocytophaga flava TaxID=3048013 RepID=A0ABT7CX22_9BACT|nr:DUF5958 family protein [Xanthocytophaga flavus]MDJ1498318.1 DUF5958 family protein [Xanthocytophaga flavus]